VADTPQEVLDAVQKDGEQVMVEVAEEAIAMTFDAAIKAGYTVLRLVVNS
jgi:hypothetical protein